MDLRRFTGLGTRRRRLTALLIVFSLPLFLYIQLYRGTSAATQTPEHRSRKAVQSSAAAAAVTRHKYTPVARHNPDDAAAPRSLHSARRSLEGRQRSKVGSPVVGLKHGSTGTLSLRHSNVSSKAATSAELRSDMFRGHIIQQPAAFIANWPTPIYCSNITLDRLRVPLCQYNYSATSFVQEEAGDLAPFVELVRTSGKKTLVIDIGPVSGLFTLSAAQLTDVIALEPFPAKMGLLVKGLLTGGLTKNVTLVIGAVLARRQRFEVVRGSDNVDTLTSALSDKCREWLHSNRRHYTFCGQRIVHSITVDDLLPLIEPRHKAVMLRISVDENIFTESSAAAFFRRADVRHVQVHWSNCQQKSARDIGSMVEFFHTRSYAIQTRSRQILSATANVSCKTWPRYVLFSKTEPQTLLERFLNWFH